MPVAVSMNGFNLVTQGYCVDKLSGRHEIPIRPSFGASLPGTLGITAGIGPFGVRTFGMEMWVDDCDPTTGVHGGWAQYDRNKIVIASAFTNFGGKLNTLAVTDEDGIQKFYDCRVAAYVMDEEARRVKVALELPTVFGRSSTLISAGPASTVFGTYVQLTGLQTAKSAAPIYDGQLRVYGPITNPSVTDWISGQSVQLQGVTVASNESWILDSKKRTSVVVNNTTGASTNVFSKTRFVPAQFGSPLLEIWPNTTNLVTPNIYRLNVNGTGTDATTSKWSLSCSASYF